MVVRDKLCVPGALMYVITLLDITMSWRMSMKERLARQHAGVLMWEELRVQGPVRNEEWEERMHRLLHDILNIEREGDIEGIVGVIVSEVLRAENKILTTMTSDFNKGAERELSSGGTHWKPALTTLPCLGRHLS